jgi:CheY-like chemotaxis protein
MVDRILEQELWLLGMDRCEGRGKAVCSYLRDGGYRARTASLDELAERRPLGILLDLSPYSADGWGMFLQLKRDPQTRDIPVLPLFLSEEGRIGGVFPAAGFFTLPVDVDYLVKRLVVLGLTEEAEMWDLQALVVSRSGEDQVSKSLESLGFHVVKAYTGKEGIALATTEPRYLVFSTLMLPDMSAFELMDRFRLFPYTKNIPFFVLMKDSMRDGEKIAMTQHIEHLVRKKDISRDEFLGYLRRRG